MQSHIENHLGIHIAAKIANQILGRQNLIIITKVVKKLQNFRISIVADPLDEFLVLPPEQRRLHEVIQPNGTVVPMLGNWRLVRASKQCPICLEPLHHQQPNQTGEQQEITKLPDCEVRVRTFIRPKFNPSMEIF